MAWIITAWTWRPFLVVVGMIESGPELSFLERHKLVAYLVVAWAVGIITAIVWVWLANFGKAGMPDA